MQTILRKITWAQIGLALILTIGLVLRLYGIKWGLPDATHPEYSYHPDESLHLLMAEWLATGTIYPKHFMYGGTVYFAILNAIARVAEVLQDLLGGESLLADAILLGRYVLVGIALITITLVYHVGRLLFDRPIGLLAALFLAIAPAHIVFSQQVRPDEIAAFLVVVIFYLSIKIFLSKPNNMQYCAYVGLMLGASISFRFPLAVYASVPLVALLLASAETSVVNKLRSLSDRRVVVIVLCAPIAYVLTSPQTLMHPETFIVGLRTQWAYQSGLFPDAIGMGPGIYQYGWLMLRQALGYALYILVAIGMVLAVHRRSPADWLLLIAVVPFLLMTSFTSWVVVRYVLPILPFLAILAASAVLRIEENTKRKSYISAKVMIVSAAVVVTLLANLAYLKLQAGPNVREIATNWIRNNIPSGSSIIMAKAYVEDDFFNPVIPPGYAPSTFILRDHSDTSSVFKDNPRDYLVMSEFFYRNMERLGERHPSDESRRFYLTLLQSRYRQVAEFKQPLTFAGLNFSGWFTSHDYTIVNPGIRIYQLQK